MPTAPTLESQITRPQECDLLLHGMVLVTCDAALGVLSDGAIAVSGDRIVAVGASSALKAAWRARRVIDGAGRLALPGLVNTHNHTPLTVVRGMAEDLGHAPAYIPGVPQGHKLSADSALAFARLGAYELLRFGSTTVVDYYRHPQASAAAFAEVGLRAFVGGRIHDADMSALAEPRRRHDPTIGRTTLAETAELIARWDGAEGGRIRCVVAPHAPDTCSAGLLRETAALAAAGGFGVHTHLAQSREEVARVRDRDGLGVVDLLAEAGLLDTRLVAAHCVFLDADEVARAGAAGIRVAHAPLGNAAAGMVAPILALAAAGATITIGTDTKSGDMFESMRMAIALARIGGGDYRTNAVTALGWATAGGASALGLEDEIGSIAPGRKADLLVLDRAPNLCPVVDGPGVIVHSASGANVDIVLVDGRILLEGGRPTLFDGEEIIASAQEVATRLWAESGWRPVLAA